MIALIIIWGLGLGLVLAVSAQVHQDLKRAGAAKKRDLVYAGLVAVFWPLVLVWVIIAFARKAELRQAAAEARDHAKYAAGMPSRWPPAQAEEPALVPPTDDDPPTSPPPRAA